MKILVCEDDLITLKALEYSLKKEGYQILSASDGKLGVDLLRENVNEIEMMITDQHMPYFSGLELVNEARNKLNATFPVIMLTRVNTDESKNLAGNLGVTEYITKPFLPKELIMKVKYVLENLE